MFPLSLPEYSELGSLLLNCPNFQTINSVGGWSRVLVLVSRPDTARRPLRPQLGLRCCSGHRGGRGVLLLGAILHHGVFSVAQTFMFIYISLSAFMCAQFNNSTCIIRLNSVKNTNFGLDNKKLFLMHWKIVFWVTDHFSVKWFFWKMPFSAWKTHFLDKIGLLTPAGVRRSGDVKELFLGGVFC